MDKGYRRNKEVYLQIIQESLDLWISDADNDWSSEEAFRRIADYDAKNSRQLRRKQTARAEKRFVEAQRAEFLEKDQDLLREWTDRKGRVHEEATYWEPRNKKYGSRYDANWTLDSSAVLGRGYADRRCDAKAQQELKDYKVPNLVELDDAQEPTDAEVLRTLDYLYGDDSLYEAYIYEFTEWGCKGVSYYARGFLAAEQFAEDYVKPGQKYRIYETSDGQGLIRRRSETPVEEGGEF